MDAKLKEDVFRRYLTALEHQDEAHVERRKKKTWHKDLEALLSIATALLGAYQPDPGQRFRMVPFYEVVENSLRCQKGANLKSLEKAFHTLETICTNLLLYPWKKEFRCIKTFTGPYVYNLKSVVSDGELRTLMRVIGYGCDRDSHFRLQEPPGGAASAAHLRQLAFELFLAQAECRLLGEVVSLARGSASELEALQLRRGCRDDAAGCADALRRRDSLGADVARLAVRPPDAERPHAYQLRRGSRPSKSVDVTDGAGHWHGATCRPVLKASLSLRKEPLLVDAEEDEKDEILRPPAAPPAPSSLFSVAPPHSSYGPPAVDFFPVQAPPPAADAHPSAYQLSSLDEMDLYTERGGGGGPAGGRQTPSSRLRDGWLLKGHGGGGGVQCQGCGGGCPPSSAPCRRCDGTLCSACHHLDPAPCCAPPQELHPRAQRPLVRDKLSVYAHPPHPLTLGHAHPHPQPLSATKLFPSKTTTSSALSKSSGASELLNLGPRCGFCDMPAASHTCLSCSKVSCGSCYSLYSFDTCTRKNPQHSFVPNDQLNFKSSTMSHLVFR